MTEAFLKRKLYLDLDSSLEQSNLKESRKNKKSSKGNHNKNKSHANGLEIKNIDKE